MPFPSGTPNLNSGDDGLKIWSCTNCRRRKVRCDRRDPCFHCSKANAECTFPIAGRVPRRVRGGSRSRNIAPKHEELLSRLRNLEAMVSQLGSQVEDAAVSYSPHGRDDREPLPVIEDAIQLETPTASTGSLSENNHSSTPQESDTMVIQNNGDLIVGDRFWTIFCGEVERIFEAARGPEPYSFEVHTDLTSGSDSHNRSHINYYSFLLRQAEAAANYDSLHPHPSQMLLLWQTYVDDVDPFVKILHVPSITRLIRDLRGQYHSLKPATEALIFAVSLTAVSALNEEDIHEHFKSSKQEVVSRYRLCTEQAFEKTDVLTSNSLESLQAFALYVYSFRFNEESKAIWSLSGVLLRIALRLNLHKDPANSTSTSMTALEREARRRLWWQICLTDSASGSSSVSKFLVSEDMFDTQIPSNIDDADINTITSNITNTDARRTDSTIFLIRCEIWRLSRRLQSLVASKNMSTDNPTAFFQNARIQFSEKYLKHLRSDIPLDCFVNTMVQLFFTKIELCLLEDYLGSDAQTALNKRLQAGDNVFIPAVSILDYTYSLQNEPTWKAWRWHIQNEALPYHALAIVLKYLCTRPWNSTSDQALSSASRIYSRIPEGSHQQLHFTKLLSAAESYRKNHAPSDRFDQVPSVPAIDTSQREPILDERDDFDFTMFESADAWTNLGIWDEMTNFLEPLGFGSIGTF